MSAVEQRPSRIIQTLQKTKNRVFPSLEHKSPEDAWTKANIAALEGIAIAILGIYVFRNIDVVVGGLSLGLFEFGRTGVFLSKRGWPPLHELS